jgi:hypothetical protein
MPTIEQLVPGLAELRAEERKNRALAFAALPLRLCGELVSPLTPRTRLELQLLRNAFAARGVGRPLRGDVFEFVWTHALARRKAPGPLGLFDAVRQKRLAARLRRRPHDDNVREIHEHLTDQLQDMPGSSVDGNGGRGDNSAWIHWIAQDAGFWISIHGGFTLAEYLDTPMLVLQQLFRVWSVNNPETILGSDGRLVALEPSFLNASDRVASRWLNDRKAAVAATIRSQRERLS